jgi:rubrerythrin
MFSTPLSQDASKEEIIGYAMDQEMKMVEFYRGFEEEFTNQWKLAKLWGMIEEEVSHVRRLQDMLSRT